MAVKNKLNGGQNVKEITPEQIILNVIAESKIGASCSQDRGPGCAVEQINFNGNMPHHSQLNLSKEEILDSFRTMLRARYSDEKHLTLVKQGKSFFHIGCSGHEAVQTAVAMTLNKGKDWGWTYYRDAAFTYGMGMTTNEYFLLAAGKPECLASGGRQMPGHYGNPKLNLPTSSSPTGTQFLNAVGTALASKKNGEDEVTYVSSGEGTTSQGEFYEAVNWASREKLPVLFCIQDNGYAISVPREHQSMGNTVGHSFCCYSTLKMLTFDGTDFFESYKAAKSAIAHIRAGKGPALLHALVERLMPHSSSDDQKKYRPSEELDSAKKTKDCILKLKNYLLQNQICDENEISEIEIEINDFLKRSL